MFTSFSHKKYIIRLIQPIRSLISVQFVKMEVRHLVHLCHLLLYHIFLPPCPEEVVVTSIMLWSDIIMLLLRAGEEWHIFCEEKVGVVVSRRYMIYQLKCLLNLHHSPQLLSSIYRSIIYCFIFKCTTTVCSSIPSCEVETTSPDHLTLPSGLCIYRISIIFLNVFIKMTDF